MTSSLLIKVVLTGLYVLLLLPALGKYKSLFGAISSNPSLFANPYVLLTTAYSLIAPLLLIAAIYLGWKVDTNWFWLGAPVVLIFVGYWALLFLH